ncbi:unnamed protein product [Protopolystoma xenopodis]|uniref:Uncharacterized protein n=1 Tax=Protopolystoma xenopodis TaxID=117903 RepID=A0A3S5BLZ6_9PLAT|nr:unnamed protein product [Protopolystoma xenopodis]
MLLKSFCYYRVSGHEMMFREAAWETEQQNQLSRDWPSRGEIEFSQYSTRYRPNLNMALDSLDLRFLPGEKVNLSVLTKKRSH